MDGFIPGDKKPYGANSPVELLYEDAGTGRLGVDDDGKAFRRQITDPAYGNVASLSGSEPTFGIKSREKGPTKGLGGSQVDAGGVSQGVRQNPAPSLAQLSPDQLMALAKRMEEDLMAQRRAEEGSTAVDSTIIKSRYGGSITPEAPDWLVQYMEQTPNMGEFQSGGLDKVKAKQYLSQQEMLRHLKAQQ